MQGALLGIFATLLALFAYAWSYARSRDRIRSLLIATLFLGAGFAGGRPLLGYVAGTPERVAEQKRHLVAAALADHAGFQALRRYDPASYEQSIHILATAPAYRELKPGQPAWNRAVRSELATLFRRHEFLAKAGDAEALGDYAHSLLAAVEALADADGDNCHRYLTAEAIDGPALLAPELLQAEAAAAGAIVAAASTAPVSNAGQQLPWAALQPIEAQIRDEFQADWRQLWEPWQLDVGKAQFCQMNRRFLKLVLRLPEPERAQTLRAWLRPHG